MSAPVRRWSARNGSETLLAVVTRDAFVTWEMKELLGAARQRGAALAVIDPLSCSFDVTHARLHLRKMDGAQPEAVLGRIDLDALEAGVRLLELLRGARIPILNGAQAFRRGRDKALAALAFEGAGVPHPPTWLVHKGDLDGALAHVDGPVVAKPIVGAGGLGVLRLERASRLRALPAERFPLLVQAYCGPVRRDLRVLTLCNEAIGAIERKAAPGEWRGNLALGAQGRPIRLAPDLESLALAGARAVGADFAGVDLIETAEGAYVIEVNVAPGFKGFSAVTGIDVAGRVVDALLRAAQSAPRGDGA